MKNAYLWTSFVLFGIANCSPDSTTDTNVRGGSGGKVGTASGGSGHKPATPIFPTGGAAQAGVGGESAPTVAESGAGGAAPVPPHPTYEDECADDLMHVVPKERECPANDACPLEQPDEADACNAAGGAGPDAPPFCTYLSANCSCTLAGWTCEEHEHPYCLYPVEVRRLCPPSGVDESKQIKDLTADERLAWCNWFGDPSGAPRPTVRPHEGPDLPLSDLLDELYGEGLCMLELPVDLCLQTFGARPDCEATVGDLDDCVETLRATSQDVVKPDQFSGWVGNRCAALRAQPSCDGLFVTDYNGCLPAGVAGAPSD